MSAVALTVAYKQTYQHGKNRGPCHLEEGKNRPWSVCLSVCLCVNQKQQSTCPSVSQKWACAPCLGEHKTKQNQKTPVAGAVALACLSHKRFDIKGGRLLSHAVARALALGHVYQERDHGSLRLIKREEAARASLHMASPQQGQLPLPASPTPTRMAGSKEKQKRPSHYPIRLQDVAGAVAPALCPLLGE